MNEDMANGYLDGRNPESPTPGADRSESYRQAFTKGRKDLGKQSPSSGPVLGETLKVSGDVSAVLWDLDRDFFAREEDRVSNSYDFDIGLQTAVLLLLKAEREGRLSEVMAELEKAELPADQLDEEF